VVEQNCSLHHQEAKARIRKSPGPTILLGFTLHDLSPPAKLYFLKVLLPPSSDSLEAKP
jgi:hypothetical protein